MRLPLPLLACTGFGLALLAVAAVESAGAPLRTLALFAAAALVTELLEEPDGERSRQPSEALPFRLASGVQLAAVLVLGGWAGALVAGSAVLTVRRFRGLPWSVAAFQTAAFTLSCLAGGLAFRLAGGHSGHVALLHDLIPVFALATAYLTVRTILLDLLAADETFQPNVGAAAAEAGIGVTLALVVIGHAWNAIALVPVLVAVAHGHARLVRLRRETVRALETFANIVDERDPSTYRHSIRVAGYVDGLARALRFPFSDIDRLRWAARLHDLGKVAVDASVLRKPTRLDPDEWAAMRRAPRLSARLLQRFQFAAAQARAVELHHERFDGTGYYGIQADDLPLASHFLIMADSFDAMTTDRPYRAGLSHELALAEIEQNAGTQFHPAVAKAFVAVQRGLDPLAVLAPDELGELRGAASAYRLPHVPGARDLKEHPELVGLGGIVIGLGGLGLHQPLLATAGGGLAAAGLGLRLAIGFRADRLAASLRRSLAASDRSTVFLQVVERVRRTWPVTWAALVAWDEDGLDGRIEAEFGQDGPPPAELVGWLVREAESGAELHATHAFELARDGVQMALPLRRENSALVGFVVLQAGRAAPLQVELALRECLDDLGLALAGRPASESQGPERMFASAR